MPEINGDLEVSNNNIPEGMGSVEEINKRVAELKAQAREGFKLARISGGISVPLTAIAVGMELAASQNHSLGLGIAGGLIGAIAIFSGSVAGRELVEATKNYAEAKIIEISLEVSQVNNKNTTL